MASYSRCSAWRAEPFSRGTALCAARAVPKLVQHHHSMCLLWLQGQGKLSVVNSKVILERYIPRASLVPRKLNFTGAVRQYTLICGQYSLERGQHSLINLGGAASSARVADHCSGGR